MKGVRIMQNPFRDVEVRPKSMAPELSDLLFDCETYGGSVRLPTPAAEYAAEAIKEHDSLVRQRDYMKAGIAEAVMLLDKATCECRGRSAPCVVCEAIAKLGELMR